MNKQVTKKIVATLTSVATVAMMTAGAFMPIAAGAITYSEEQKLYADSGLAYEAFGTPALSGDGSLMVVGARAAGPESFRGAAYIFSRTGSTWTQIQKLIAADGATEDSFGFVVSMTSDGSRVAIGAPGKSTGSILAHGAVYIFVRSGSTWVLEQKLLPAEGIAYADYFGDGLAISGDGTRIIIGGPNATIGDGSYQGAAWIFARSGSVWTQEQKLIAFDGASGDGFAYRVAIDAAGNRVAIGAGNADVGATEDQGAVYVYSRSDAIWSLEQKVFDPSGAQWSNFGASVAMDAAGNRIVVSAMNEDVGANEDQGAAIVFVRSGATWGVEAKFTASDGTSYQQFGRSIAINATGDRVIVGSPDALGEFGNPQGVAYAFSRGVAWAEDQKLTASDGAEYDQYGWDVAMDSSGNRIAIGAPYGNGALSDSGAVYVYSSVPTPTATPPPTLCLAKPGKVCICHYPDGNPENVQVIEVSSNAVKAHMKHGDDTFNELTQVCDIPVELVDSGSSSGSFVAVALAAVAAGLGIGLYLKRK